MNTGQTDKDMRNQYRGSNANGKLHQMIAEMEEVLKKAVEGGGPFALALITFIRPIIYGFCFLLVIGRGIYKVPLRYCTLSVFMSLWFYFPLLYISQNIFQRNSWFLFDPFLMIKWDNLINIFSSSEQWLTYLALLFSLLPIFSGLRFLFLNRISLLLSAVFNILMSFHLIYKGSFFLMFQLNFTQMMDMSITSSGVSPLWLFIGLVVSTISVILFWKQPKFLDPYAMHGFNSFGENPAGVFQTLTGGNNLKNPVRYK